MATVSTRRAARGKTRVIRVHTVNLDVDETPSHYLIYVSPRLPAQALGISPYRSKLPKCGCSVFGGRGSRCRFCGGWSPEGMARYVGRLLRSYPKERVVVDTEGHRVEQQLAKAAA
jgi:hypothetical protein